MKRTYTQEEVMRHVFRQLGFEQVTEDLYVYTGADMFAPRDEN